MKNKNKYGQYMTPAIIADFMVSLIEKNDKCSCLEPSSGTGIFIDNLQKHNFKNITAFEYDKALIKNGYDVKNCSFVVQNLKNKFDVVIGNPPYIRWKNLEDKLKEELKTDDLWNNYCNSLCDYSSIFILKSIEALKDNGELIFITSDYWFTTTNAEKIRDFIIENGYIDTIYHFNETPIFEKVNASFVIFKFIKNKIKHPKIKVIKYFSKKKIDEETINSIKTQLNKNVQSFEISQFSKGQKWLLVSNFVSKQIDKYENACGYQTIGQICDIGNGMVSGLDKAFQIPEGICLNKDEKDNVIKVIKAKNLKNYTYDFHTQYIFLKNINENTLLQNFNNFYQHLLSFKQSLLKRYNYGKNLNYWDWAFLRNFTLFSSRKDRIFCPCKERITNKSRFRFSVIPAGFYPTQDVTALFLKDNVEEKIEYVVALLNSKYVFRWLSNKGTRKGDIVEFSEKPISSIPYRKINFLDNTEKMLHDKIVVEAKNFIKTQDTQFLEIIDSYIEQLIA